MGKTFNNLDKLLKNGKAGDWNFSKNDDTLFLVYPFTYKETEAKDVVSLPIHKIGITDARRPSWEWDGSKEAPTLTPSINVIGRWHGFLRNGKIETC